MKQTANGNYLWLVLLAFFLIVPIVNAMKEPDKPGAFQTSVETAVEIPPKRK